MRCTLQVVIAAFIVTIAKLSYAEKILLIKELPVAKPTAFYHLIE